MTEHWDRQAPVVELLARVETRSNVETLWAERAFCPNGTCRVGDDGVLFYYDDDHPSREGAERLAVLFDDAFQRMAGRDSPAISTGPAAPSSDPPRLD